MESFAGALPNWEVGQLSRALLQHWKNEPLVDNLQNSMYCNHYKASTFLYPSAVIS